MNRPATEPAHAAHTARAAYFALIAPVALVATALFSLACGETPAADATTGDPVPAGGVITRFTDSTELFMEHPALIVGASEKFAVHLTDLTDFAPLRSGRVTLRFTPRDGGAPLVVVQETPRAPGIYGPAPVFTHDGVYDLTILVQSPQARDSISVPGLRVYASLAAAPADSGGAEGGISFLKEQQWKTDGFRTAFAVEGSIAESFDAPGEVRAADGRLAEIVAPTGGLLDLGGLVDAPIVGQRVTKGQVLVRMTPALGDAGAPFAEARARLRAAEDEHARAERLLAASAIPARRLREAEIGLAAAREAVAGLGGGSLGADGRLEIRSPIDGVVGTRAFLPGARVEAGAPLLTIVDPSVVWLVAHVPAGRSVQLDRASNVTFEVEGVTTRRRTSRVVAVGSVLDPVTRSVPITYEASNADGAARIGAVARVAVLTTRRAGGVLLPTTAILEEDGRPFVYVQRSGETFERRTVTVGGTDGTRRVVLAGLAAGERVVTGAAYQLKLASLSTAVPTHGHEH